MPGYIREIISLPICPELRAKLKLAGFGSTADLEGYNPESLSRGRTVDAMMVDLNCLLILLEMLLYLDRFANQSKGCN